MEKKKEIIRWAPVGILLTLGLVAPLFGDSPSGVITPLMLAMLLTYVNLMQQKNEKARNGG